jgi:hypothetical protein
MQKREEALKLQRPLPDDRLEIVPEGRKSDQPGRHKGPGLPARFPVDCGKNPHLFWLPPIRGARKVCAINRAKQDKLGTMPLRCYGFLVALRLKPPNNQREIRALATTPISRSLIGTASGLTFFRYPSADSVARPDQTSLIAKQRQIGRRLINVRHSSNLPRFLAQTLRAPLKRSG